MNERLPPSDTKTTWNDVIWQRKKTGLIFCALEVEHWILCTDSYLRIGKFNWYIFPGGYKDPGRRKVKPREHPVNFLVSFVYERSTCGLLIFPHSDIKIEIGPQRSDEVFAKLWIGDFVIDIGNEEGKISVCVELRENGCKSFIKMCVTLRWSENTGSSGHFDISK